jgi:hypothetical protein
MKEREINIKVTNITHKQWTNLLIELNLVKDSWRRFGPHMDIKAMNFDRIIRWGKKRHDESKES